MKSNSSSGMIIKLALILLAAVALFGMLAYYKTERFSSSTDLPQPYPTASGAGALAGSGSVTGAAAAPMASVDINAPAATSAAFAPSPLESTEFERYRPVPGVTGPSTPCDPFPQDRITPEQLLPKDAANSAWAQANPLGQGDVKDQNLLTAGFHLGFDTQGNSLRNASHDIRSSPPNPRYRVSIWNQSNIEPDLNRRPLE